MRGRRGLVISLAVIIAVGALAVLISARIAPGRVVQATESKQRSVANEAIAPLLGPGLLNGRNVNMPRIALEGQVGPRLRSDAIAGMRVWTPDGVLAYCNDPRQIGLRFPLTAGDVDVLHSGGVESRMVAPDTARFALDRSVGEALEVSVGVRDRGGDEWLVQTDIPAARVHADEASFVRRTVVAVLAGVLGLSLMVLLGFALGRRSAGRSAHEEPARTALLG
jgi:hypothetical protein